MELVFAKGTCRVRVQQDGLKPYGSTETSAIVLCDDAGKIVSAYVARQDGPNSWAAAVDPITIAEAVALWEQRGTAEEFKLKRLGGSSRQWPSVTAMQQLAREAPTGLDVENAARWAAEELVRRDPTYGIFVPFARSRDARVVLGALMQGPYRINPVHIAMFGARG